MGKSGAETTHIFDGVTIRGGADIDRLSAGANGALMNWQLPNIVFPLLMPSITWCQGIGLTFTANDLRGVRFIIPRDGTVLEAAVFIGATSAGNVDVGIYDMTLVTRTRLGSAGATAAGTANTWQVLPMTTPVAVSRGQAVDVAVGLSNNTCTIGAGTSLSHAALATLPAAAWGTTYTDPFGQTTLGVATGKMAWVIATSMPAPATLTEASLTGAVTLPFVMLRMAG